MGKGEPTYFRSARIRFAPSTPAATPPVVALEFSRVLVGIWDGAAGEYAYATVAQGISQCPREDECDNTCGEAGVEASPGMVDVVRDRDGTIVVAYLRREITRLRRWRRASGGLCDHVDCACGSVMENEQVKRAEIVILQVDPASKTVRERFVIPLAARAGKTGYDVGVDTANAPQFSADIRDGHLLLTFTGNYQGGTGGSSASQPGVSLYDLRLR